MSSKAFKIKMEQAFANGLVRIIRELQTTDNIQDDEKLLFSVLAEIASKLEVKLLNFQQNYKMKLTPSQAIGLRVLYVWYVEPNQHSTYMGNQLLTISNEVHQFYTV